MDLKGKIGELPSCPGVYLMKDAAGGVIYVGKSKNLKNRVGSYFQASKSHPPKVAKLVKHLKDLDYILTDTEFEAFMLECKLIKELKPLYNKLMKNPKAYSYIKIGINEKFPNIEIKGESDICDGNIYFGPYTSKNTVERGLQGIKECCKILCTSASQKTSACLNYSLGLCIGTCSVDYPKEQYLTILDKIVKLLKGNDKSIIETMEHNMKDASEQLNFERAAKYRDYLRAAKYLVGKAKIIDYTEKNKNIIVLERISDERIKCFLIKGNKVLSNEIHAVGNHDFEKLKSSLRTNILTCFNTIVQNYSIKIGSEEIDESQIIYSYLKSKSSSCSHVVISEKWLKASNSTKLDAALDKFLLHQSWLM